MQTIHSWKLTHTFARFMIVVLVASLLAIVSVHPSVAKAASASDCSLGNPCISATNLDCAAIDGSPCVSVQSNLTIFDNRSVTFVFKIPSTSLRTYPTAQYHVYWLEACSLICSLTPASAGNFTSTLNYWNTTLLGGEV